MLSHIFKYLYFTILIYIFLHFCIFLSIFFNKNLDINSVISSLLDLHSATPTDTETNPSGCFSPPSKTLLHTAFLIFSPISYASLISVSGRIIINSSPPYLASISLSLIFLEKSCAISIKNLSPGVLLSIHIRNKFNYVGN